MYPIRFGEFVTALLWITGRFHGILSSLTPLTQGQY